MSGLTRKVCSLLALLTVLTAVIAVDHDTMLCADDNTPVCASNRGEYLLFKNECDLRKAQRENLMGSPLFDVALHYCVPNCEFECDGQLQPICGVSVASGERKSFRNRCEMMRNSCINKSDWLVYKWGMCPRDQKQQEQQESKQPAHTLLVGQRKTRRPIPCTNVYRPVCAIYAGVKSTFSNECLVHAENLRTKRNWRIIAEGLCGEDSTKMKQNRKLKPQTKPKVQMERSKRSYKSQINQLDDFEIPEEAVEIFAPSTFHTQFISNTGTTMEKSYSLPAITPQLDQRQRQPKTQSPPKARRIYGSNGHGHGHQQAQRAVAEVKHCVFSNEPVCGSFNGESRTFTNVCALMEYSQMVGNAWTVLYEGSCRRCDKPCPTVYSPICAIRNGISYTIINECYLERVRCKDPNSVWKITHTGECSLPADEVAHSLPAPEPRPDSGIPEMLYASKRQGSSSTTSTTTTPKPTTPMPKAPLLTTTKRTPLPRRLHRKSKRPTPTPKDLSNRKIRKIEPSNYDELNSNTNDYDKDQHIQHIQMPAKSKLWNVKDTNIKKANSEKYSHNYGTQTPITPTTAAPTSEEAHTTMRELTEADFFDFDMKSAGELFGEIEADSEILYLMDTTSDAARQTDDEATTSATTTTLATTAATTATTSAATTTTSPTTTPTNSAEEEASEHEEEEESTSTKDILDQNSVETTETTASNEETTTTSSSSDEALAKQEEKTSIYGMDKNSLIMRLLHARSEKNMAL